MMAASLSVWYEDSHLPSTVLLIRGTSAAVETAPGASAVIILVFPMIGRRQERVLIASSNLLSAAVTKNAAL